MEIELTVGACSNCTGISNCNRSCILHTGKALVNFISNVDMIETKIGEYSSSDFKGKAKKDLITYGHQLYDLKSPSWLLTKIGITLDVSDKFKSLFDKNAFQIATEYCKHIKMTPAETKEITDKIKALNNNKVIILPFKPHTLCNVDFSGGVSNDKNKQAEISNLKWITNRETGKLECSIAFTSSNLTSQETTRFSITEYLKKFRLAQMELQAKGNKYDDNLISINNYGIIKPIVIKEGKASVAIDGTYLYYTINSDTHIIGYWDDSNKLIITSDIKCKAMNKINKNLDLIRNHKKYIAPYLLHESNTVEVK